MRDTYCVVLMWKTDLRSVWGPFADWRQAVDAMEKLTGERDEKVVLNDYVYKVQMQWAFVPVTPTVRWQVTDGQGSFVSVVQSK